LMAWRSAIIANSLLGRTAYDVAGESSALDFQEIPWTRGAPHLGAG